MLPDNVTANDIEHDGYDVENDTLRVTSSCR